MVIRVLVFIFRVFYIMSFCYLQRDHFLWFSNLDVLYFFFSTSFLDETSSTMLNWVVRARHSFFMITKKSMFSFLSKLDAGLLYMAYTVLRNIFFFLYWRLCYKTTLNFLLYFGTSMDTCWRLSVLLRINALIP